MLWFVMYLGWTEVNPLGSLPSVMSIPVGISRPMCSASVTILVAHLDHLPRSTVPLTTVTPFRKLITFRQLPLTLVLLMCKLEAPPFGVTNIRMFATVVTPAALPKLIMFRQLPWTADLLLIACRALLLLHVHLHPALASVVHMLATLLILRIFEFLPEVTCKLMELLVHACFVRLLRLVRVHFIVLCFNENNAQVLRLQSQRGEGSMTMLLLMLRWTSRSLAEIGCPYFGGGSVLSSAGHLHSSNGGYAARRPPMIVPKVLVMVLLLRLPSCASPAHKRRILVCAKCGLICKCPNSDVDMCTRASFPSTSAKPRTYREDGGDQFGLLNLGPCDEFVGNAMVREHA